MLKIEGDEIFLALLSHNTDQLYYLIFEKSTHSEIGHCDLRMGHNESLLYYGNIGYRINEQYRGHGYAYEAAKLLIGLAKELNMGYCIITCSPENIPSKKTIERLGATFIKTANVPLWHPLWPSERVKRIYRIDLS